MKQATMDVMIWKEVTDGIHGAFSVLSVDNDALVKDGYCSPPAALSIRLWLFISRFQRLRQQESAASQQDGTRNFNACCNSPEATVCSSTLLEHAQTIYHRSWLLVYAPHVHLDPLSLASLYLCKWPKTNLSQSHSFCAIADSLA